MKLILMHIQKHLAHRKLDTFFQTKASSNDQHRHLPEQSSLQMLLALLGEVLHPAQVEPEAPVSIYSVQVKHGSP